MLFYQVFAPFVALIAWALILAVTLYPAHQRLARRMKGPQGLAATLLVLVGIVLIVAPTTLLLLSLGDSIHDLIDSVHGNTLQIPAPPPSVADWPLVGNKVHGLWAQAHSDLPAFIQSMQPKIGDLTRQALGMVASIGGTVLLFFFSFIIAGIIMAFGRPGARGMKAIFDRIAGIGRGEEFIQLSTATIRAVALGVLGVAFIQAIVDRSRIAGRQAYRLQRGSPCSCWCSESRRYRPSWLRFRSSSTSGASGDYGNASAITFTVLLFIAGMLDNVLKPLLLGRGVNAPMPVVLLGALGGLASGGILGMFVGATLLTLGYQIFMRWVAANPDGPNGVT